MKKGMDGWVDKKSQEASGSGVKWRDIAIYILSAILIIQVLVLFVWIPQCWRARFYNQQVPSPYFIEEIMIGGVLSARNIKNADTGRSM